MLWGAFLAKMIDRELKAASAYLWILAGFTFFDIIHSAIPDGNMYLPWNLAEPARQIPYQFGAAYAALAALMLLLSLTKESRQAPDAQAHS
jgi:AGZA family xanthine/uracil permease-like MFS transporter